MNSIVHPDVWNQDYRDVYPGQAPSSVFADLLGRTCKPGGTCFEVGCYPGGYLHYLGKQHGCIVSGIDQTPYVISRLLPWLETQGIHVGKLYREDFLQFTPEMQYDLVYSLGFVEHFTDFREVLVRHIALTAPGGTLVVAAPHFRRVQYVLHRCLDSENLKRHVLEAMDLNAWDRVLNENGMQTVFARYHQTAEFWVARQERGLLSRILVRMACRTSRFLESHLNYPNRWTSPYLVHVSRKLPSVGHAVT